MQHHLVIGGAAPEPEQCSGRCDAEAHASLLAYHPNIGKPRPQESIQDFVSICESILDSFDLFNICSLIFTS